MNDVDAITHPFSIPWAVGHQAPLPMSFPPQEYWGGLPFAPGDLLDPGIKPESPACRQRLKTYLISNSFFFSLLTISEISLVTFSYTYFVNYDDFGPFMMT